MNCTRCGAWYPDEAQTGYSGGDGDLCHDCAEIEAWTAPDDEGDDAMNSDLTELDEDYEEWCLKYDRPYKEWLAKCAKRQTHAAPEPIRDQTWLLWAVLAGTIAGFVAGFFVGVTT